MPQQGLGPGTLKGAGHAEIPVPTSTSRRGGRDREVPRSDWGRNLGLHRQRPRQPALWPVCRQGTQSLASNSLGQPGKPSTGRLQGSKESPLPYRLGGAVGTASRASPFQKSQSQGPALAWAPQHALKLSTTQAGS